MGRRVAGVLLAAGLALWSSSAWAGPGRLDRVRDEVSGSSDSSSSSDDGDDGWSSDGSGGSGFGAAIGEALIAGSARVRYRPYPYADGRRGYVFWAAAGELDASVLPDDELALGPEGPPPPPVDTGPPERGRIWSLQLGLEGAFLPTDTVRTGFGGAARLGLFELNSSWNAFHEFDVADRLWLGDLNLGLTAGAGPALLHVGAGPSFLIDPTVLDPAQRTLVGFNAFSSWLEVFPLRPLVVRVRGDIGLMGEATYWRARGSLGATWRKIEVFAGYEHLQIGTVPLGGPMLGLRLRI